MKKKISAEKLIYVSLISVFCIITLILTVRINGKMNEISSATPVVIHDVTTTGKEDRGKKTVYITLSGKKYHHKDCSYLGEKIIAVTKDEAIQLGFESCTKCQP